MREMLSQKASSRLGIRMGRYALGSLVAVTSSEVAFVASYGTGLLGTTGSSAVAFLAGAAPNYVLNRSWAWGRRGRVRLGREVVLYVAVSLLGLGCAAVATRWASHAASRFTSGHAQATALVAGAYLATYGLLFIVKFLVYQLVIFSDRREPNGDAPATMSR